MCQIWFLKKKFSLLSITTPATCIKIAFYISFHNNPTPIRFFNILFRLVIILMLGKAEILVVIFALLLVFYIVIVLGAGRRKSSQSSKITSYLFGVRVLIIIIAIVALILWFFL